MAKITSGEVDKIANLARIEISEKEKNKYSREMTDILGFVEKLNKAETKDVDETSQVTGLENVYREDIASELTQVDKNKEINREKLLKNAPAEKDGYIKVKAVLE